MIRKVTKDDVYRLSEIIVYNNRINYYPIFKDIEYSFKLFNVKDVGDDYLNDTDFMDNTYVYIDEVIKGFIYVKDGEIVKLYVDSFFQDKGIGKALLDYALNECHGNWLWALEKNTRAIAFYKRNSFEVTDERKLEEGTSEYLVKLIRCMK